MVPLTKTSVRPSFYISAHLIAQNLPKMSSNCLQTNSFCHEMVQSFNIVVLKNVFIGFVQCQIGLRDLREVFKSHETIGLGF